MKEIQREEGSICFFSTEEQIKSLDLTNPSEKEKELDQSE